VGTGDAREGSRDSGGALVAALAMLAALGHELGCDWHGGGARAEHGGTGLLRAVLLRCRQGVVGRGGGAQSSCA